MTKNHTKLLVFLSVLICSLCLIFGITACNSKGGSNTDDHKHTFGGFWLFDGADGHYQLATCHPEVKSELESHVDETGDFRCDVCDYVMHVHVDENDNNICDECQSEIHKHTFADEWSFNENKHWHKATCEHFIERDGYANHSFTDGVCECGVKESEVKVYDLYKNSVEYELYFTQWLDWLAENKISEVEYTESGDGIYHYEDGRSEVRFVGERTITVRATSDDKPVAHVWIMVTLYYNGSYYEYNGSLALGLAETGSDGIAEITFRPIGGYSSEQVVYRARLAETKDIAGYLGIAEEEAAKPIPNRYEAAGATGAGGIEVGENEITGIVAEFNFNYSKGWNAYDTIVLPYARYYTNPLDDTSKINEENLTYSFTTSGENLFDYMYFIPANNYSFAAANPTTPPDQLLIIEQNFAKSASGIYKLHFEVEGDATATLYFWNEEGVNLGAYHETNKDGTPAGKYITSISGGTAGNGHYSGGNFVNVVIKPAEGLRYYQLGLKTSETCKVTMTVERTGDYVEDKTANYTFDWAESDGTKLSLTGSPKLYKTTSFALVNVPQGLYRITFDNNDYNGYPDFGIETIYYEKNSTAMLMYTNDDMNNKFVVWEGSMPSVSSSFEKPSYDYDAMYRAVFWVTEDTNMLYVDTEVAVGQALITLEKYEYPSLSDGERVYLPVASQSAQSYAVPLDGSLSGEYNISVLVCGVRSVSYAPLTVNIGGRVVSLTAKKYNVKMYYYEGTVTFESGDSSLTFTNGVTNSYLANVTLTKAA